MQDPNEKELAIEEINAEFASADPDPEEDTPEPWDETLPEEPEWEDQLGDAEEHPEIPFGLPPSIKEIREAYSELFSSLDTEAQSEVALKSIDIQLEQLKYDYKRKCALAIANWNKDAKEPYDPTLPCNDGSNDEKRALINEKLFAYELAVIADLQSDRSLAEQQAILDRCDARMARHRTEMLSLLVRLVGTMVSVIDSAEPEYGVE